MRAWIFLTYNFIYLIKLVESNETLEHSKVTYFRKQDISNESEPYILTSST